MAFTAADVKNLREMTGVGMMDCKKALTASDGDMDKAVEFLREKGLAASAKKAGRVAAEGMAYAAVIDGVGVVVEVNAETDFVGKNEKFVDFVKGVAATVAANKPADLEALMACKYNGTDLTVEQQQQEMVLVIGENIKVRRFAIFTEGVSVPYIHAGGKIGVLVNLKVEGDIDATAVGKDVAMQIAALNPRFWDKSQVSQDVLDEEKKIMMVQMENDPKMASKPEQVREKIVMGKMNKFYSENCLLQQEFVRGDVFTGSVEQYIADAAKKLGGKITFVDAIRFEKGEEPYQVKVSIYNALLDTVATHTFNGTGDDNVVKKLGEISLNREQTKSTMLFFVLDIIKDNKNIYRNYYFTNYEVRPGSIVSMPQTEIKMERTGNMVTLTNTGKHPAIGVHIEAPEKMDQLIVSENYIWLNPQESKILKINLESPVIIKGWNLQSPY